MSGGVDSSVAALLLKKQGYRVIGMFMKNWEETDENGVCHAAEDFADVERVCEQIDIPYYGIEFVDEYWNNVFSRFLEEYQAGHTPNPDILCNKEIKFKLFLKKAEELGADYLATGHYAQIGRPEGLDPVLLKGVDAGKDQSYFIYTLNRSILENVLFPIGHLQKSEVREIAREAGLAVSEKKDSTGICFIGERKFRSFLSQYLKTRPGKFKTLSGETVGEHGGVPYYTMGQRKGLGLGGEGDAWFVVGKDIDKNIVYVERGSEHPALYSDELIAVEETWVAETAPELPLRCRAKIRYRQADQECEISRDSQGRLLVRFTEPQRAVTPRQSVVFYDGDVCLGGAVIDSAGPSHYKLAPKRSLVSDTSQMG